MNGFIKVTAHTDGSLIHIRASTVNSVYRSDDGKGTFLGHENTTPGQTIVSGSGGQFAVTETVSHVMAKLHTATTAQN